MDEDCKIGFCPHCGNACTHRLIARHETEGKCFNHEVGRQEDVGWSQEFYLAVCETCDQPLLYCADDLVENWNPEHSNFQNARLLWPDVADLSDAVPSGVRRRYREAARILAAAPTAYAIQIRAALEALCDDRGAVRGGLQKRLQDLAFKNDIPPVLAEMSEVVRVLGNIGAHDHEHEISAYDAAVIDGFFKSIIEYVYEAPKRIQDYRIRMANFGKQDQSDSNTLQSRNAAAAGAEKPVN